MGYRIAHDEAGRRVEVTYSGAVTRADFEAASADAIGMQRAKGILRFVILFDDDARITASKIDIYKLPTEDYGKAKVDRRTRIAVVLPEAGHARNAALFYEDASRNRGWNVRSFADHATAVSWLESSSSKGAA